MSAAGSGLAISRLHTAIHWIVPHSTEEHPLQLVRQHGKGDGDVFRCFLDSLIVTGGASGPHGDAQQFITQGLERLEI
jgi:hypothetical protein